MAARPTPLVDRVRATLGGAGFALGAPGPARAASFDVVARRGRLLLLVKTFANADSLGEPLAAELRVLAGLLRASPLLVGERSSTGPLEDGVLYVRHRVPLLTPATLEAALLGDEPPLVYAAPGGYYVDLDGPMLRALRARRGLSLGQVAEAAGVSRRAVAMYEEGMGALVEVARRLEELFRTALVRPVGLFQCAEPAEPPAFDPALVREELQREVLERLRGLGYRVVVAQRALFNAVSQDIAHEEVLILTGVGELEPPLYERARALQSLGAIAGREVVVIVRDRRSIEQVAGAPVIGKDELERMEGTEEVVELIEERRAPRR